MVFLRNPVSGNYHDCARGLLLDDYAQDLDAARPKMRSETVGNAKTLCADY